MVNSLKCQNVLYDVSTPLLKNSFIKKGYEFAGWNIYFPKNSTWLYKNSEGTSGWYSEGKQPSGYSKAVYPNKQKVSRTATRGNTVVFCATWKATNKFYVAFNPNVGGSGTMPSQTITFDTPKTMPANTFTKSGREFKGWEIYNCETSKWLYLAPNGTDTAWYKEGEAPTGYLKRIYVNQTTIARTAQPGQHLIFYAHWNEFIIYYDANGKSVIPGCEKTPTFAVYGKDNTIKKFASSDVLEGGTFRGYREHRLELDKWRYQNKTNSSLTAWFNKNTVDTSVYELFVFKANTVKQTVQIGEHVVFQAVW